VSVDFSIRRPDNIGKFAFVILATQRAAQLMRGCTSRIDGGTHKAIVIAQGEVAAGMVVDTSAGVTQAPNGEWLPNVKRTA
jgi:DNA-directed RNA polymerase subunit K/omega